MDPHPRVAAEVVLYHIPSRSAGLQAKALPSSNSGHVSSHINGDGGDAPQLKVSCGTGGIDPSNFVK
jgi:hypothetical protein